MMAITISILIVIAVGIFLDALTFILTIRRVANGKGPSGIPVIPFVLYIASVWNLHLSHVSSALLLLLFICFHIFCQFLPGMIYTYWVDSKVPLHKWIRWNKISKVTHLLEQGVDDSVRNGFNETPLHVAARSGRDEIASMLLSRGADPNLKDHQGYTPLHMAVAWGHITTTEILLSNGADAGITNNQGLSPRDFVSKNRNPALYAVVNNRQE